MNSTLIALIPKDLLGKRKLLGELETQLNALNKKKSKENEAQRAQLGDFISILKKNIEEHEKSLRTVVHKRHMN